jgi:hypothetical protein
MHLSPRCVEPVWDELYPAEQARILRLVIERIDVAPDGILRHAECRRDSPPCGGAGRPGVSCSAAPEPLLEAAEYDLALGSRGRHSDDPHPMRMQRRGGKLIMIPAGVAAPARKPSRNETLVKALVRAHRWRHRIESGLG